MGPLKGLKRRRKQESKASKQAAYAAAGLPSQPADWWDDFSKRISGTEDFETLFKMSRETFNYICGLVRDDLAARKSSLAALNGRPLSIDDQVAVALRRLSSGDSLLTVGQLFGVNQSTVSQVTWRFVEAMEERGLHHLRWPSPKELESIKAQFEGIRGLPNCCGAIDATHIVMCLPSVDQSNAVWLDPEKKHSMLVQAIVDPALRILDVVVGWPGSISEAHVLRSSGFFQLCERGARLNGAKTELEEQGSELREYLVGDSGYPLLPWLLTPFRGGRELPEAAAEFNKRHQATRLVAQRALARLKDTWRIVGGEMWRPDRHRLPRIILVCCILHNVIIDLEGAAVGSDRAQCTSYGHDSGYRQQQCDFSDPAARATRDRLARYLSGGLPP
ncbi:PIF / Ping-Pong family of plant transposase [Wolffia australiana]